MRFASAFLSYTHADEALVVAVAQALGRRGIIAWRDKDYLLPGERLDHALPRAIHEQVVFVPFISEGSLKRRWCREELGVALDVERAQRPDDAWITPVLLGDPLDLWRASDGLLDDWMTPDFQQMRKLGIPAKEDQDPERIAHDIARTVYRRICSQNAENVVIVIDQRGDGSPTGHPGRALVPRNTLDQDWPALTFRPSDAPRTDKALVEGAPWSQLANTLRQALSEALPPPRGKAKLWIYGDGQLALFYLLGAVRDRTGAALLFCARSEAARGDKVISNQEWSREPLRDPQESLTSLLAGGCEALTPGTRHPEVGLRIMEARDPRLPDAAEYASLVLPDTEPMLTMEHDATLTQTNVSALVSRIETVAVLLRRDHRTAHIHLYTSLPAQILPLLAWRLGGPGLPEVVFMEFRHASGANPRRFYAPLRLRAEEPGDGMQEEIAHTRTAPAPAESALRTLKPVSRTLAPPSPALYRKMRSFLVDRFDPDGVGLLARSLDCAPELTRLLRSGPLSAEVAVDDLLVALQRLTGGLPPDLFERLREERPAFSVVVEARRAEYLLGSS